MRHAQNVLHIKFGVIQGLCNSMGDIRTALQRLMVQCYYAL